MAQQARSGGGNERSAPDRLDVTLDGGFILDGEAYEGGALTIAKGTPLDFFVP